MGISRNKLNKSTVNRGLKEGEGMAMLVTGIITIRVFCLRFIIKRVNSFDILCDQITEMYGLMSNKDRLSISAESSISNREENC